MVKLIAIAAIGLSLISCKERTAQAASVTAAAPVAKSTGTIKPETKVRLLVYQAKLASIEQAIEQSPLGQQRRAVTPKFQAELASARQDCRGGEPTFGEDDVVCAPAPKK